MHNLPNGNEIEDNAQGDAQIEKKRDQPAVVISVQDETRNPPTKWTSSVAHKVERTQIDSPGEKKPYKYLENDAPSRPGP